MNDAEHASRIWRAAKLLNDTIKDAAEAGLRVEINVREIQHIERRWPTPMIEAMVTKQVEIE